MVAWLRDKLQSTIDDFMAFLRGFDPAHLPAFASPSAPPQTPTWLHTPTGHRPLFSTQLVLDDATHSVAYEPPLQELEAAVAAVLTDIYGDLKRLPALLHQLFPILLLPWQSLCVDAPPPSASGPARAAAASRPFADALVAAYAPHTRVTTMVCVPVEEVH